MLKKPKIDKEAALDFAEKGIKAKRITGNKVPIGDTRMTANISIKHHRKIKAAAANQGTTIGELIEHMIDKHL